MMIAVSGYNSINKNMGTAVANNGIITLSHSGINTYSNNFSSAIYNSGEASMNQTSLKRRQKAKVD